MSFQDLKKFYKIITPKSISNNKNIDKNKYTLLKENLLEKKLSNSEILNVFRTNSTSSEFIKLTPFIDTGSIDLKKNLVYYKDNTPNKTNSKLLTLSFNSFLSPGIIFGEDVDFFVNGIPTLEMSKCTPYFDIYFEFDNIKGEVIDFIDQRKLFGVDNNEKLKGVNTIGMEHMLMPQTMNSNDIMYNGNDLPDLKKHNIPTHKYSGILSMDGFNIEIRPTKGFMSFKSANANIKLHKRQFLRKFAQLFKPEYFSRVSAVVTYGWIHPDIHSENPYAEFINSKMLVREIYGIANTSHSFENDGSVSISTEFYTKFSKEVLNVGIGMTQNDINKTKALFEISSIIEEIINSNQYLQNEIFKSDKKDTLPQKLVSFSASGNPNFDMTFEVAVKALGQIENFSFTDKERTDLIGKQVGEAKTEAQQQIQQANDLVNSLSKQVIKFLILSLCDSTSIDIEEVLNSNKQQLDSLIDQVRGILSDPKKNKVASIFDAIKKQPFVKDTIINKNTLSKGKINDMLRSNFKQKISNKFQKIINDAQANDQYIKLFLHTLNQRSVEGKFDSQYQKSADSINKRFKQNQVVSLGYLFETMVSDSLILTTQFSKNPINIQVYFFSFNESAGAILRDIPISWYPIDIEEFKKKYVKYVSQKNEEFMTVEEFFNFFRDNEIEDHRSLTSPLHSFFKGTRENKKDDDTSYQFTNNKTSKSELESYSIIDKRKIPKLTCTIECTDNENLLGQTIINGKSKVTNKETIMRISIYDDQLNPYGEIKEIKFDNNSNKFNVEYLDGDTEAISNDLSNNNNFTFSLNEYLSRNIPTMTIGTSNSNVTSISLSTNQNPRDSAVRIKQHYKADEPREETTVADNITLPMRVIPAQMSIGLVGCPIIPYSQKMFVNLGTGTTIDSIYCVTGISHTISNGKFETNLTLVVNDGFAQFENVIKDTNT